MATKQKSYKEFANGTVVFEYFYEGIAPFSVCRICGGLIYYKQANYTYGHNFEHYCPLSKVELALARGRM